MLFSLLTSLVDQYSFLNVFKYLTFRTGLSVVTSLVVVFIIGGPLIKLFSENNLISGPPIIKTTTKDVTTDNPVLNVRYLKTFKNEYWSTKDVKRLKSI